MSKSLIQESPELRKAIKDRFNEQKLTLQAISDDAALYGVNINIYSLSKYLNNSKIANLTEEVVIWIAFRWGIYVNVLIGNPQIKNDRLSSVILPYDEERCLRFLKHKYGDKNGIKKEVAKPKRVSKSTSKAG